MAGKALNVVQEIVLADGLVALPADILRELLPLADGDKAYSRKGVVLANDRKSGVIMHGEGVNAKPVEYMVSLYVQRAPLDEDEQASVDAKATSIDERKTAKGIEEQAKREREIDAACNRTQAVVLSNLQNIGTLVGAAQGIAKHYGLNK